MGVRKITTNASSVRGKLAPLYHRYPGQYKAQPAYIEVNPSNGSIRAGYSSKLDNALPQYIWDQHAYRWSVPASIKGIVLAKLLEEPHLHTLVRGMCDGHSFRLEGSTVRGVLTDDALKIADRLQIILESLTSGPGVCVTVMSVEHWRSKVVRKPKESLERLAGRIVKEAAAADVLLEGDIEEYLRGCLAVGKQR